MGIALRRLVFNRFKARASLFARKGSLTMQIPKESLSTIVNSAEASGSALAGTR